MTCSFLDFLRSMVPHEGAFGPAPIVPPFLERWLRLAFPLPEGDPAARNIADLRSKKQGKSSLAGAVALYMGTRKPYSQVVIASADLDQSRDRVLRACKFAVEQGPLGAHARIFKDAIEFDNRSTIQALPQDWRGAAGGDYSCVIFDELHVFQYEQHRRLWDELVIPPTQPHGVRWTSSYAGWHGQSDLLEELWARALAGVRVDADLPFYRNLDAGLLAFVDVGPASWRMPWTTAEYMHEVEATERPNAFRRLFLNEWVSSESQFVERDAWLACYDPTLRPTGSERMVLGIDASTTRDSTAAVGCAFNPKTNAVEVVLVRVWRPVASDLRGGKPTIDLMETVWPLILNLHRDRKLAKVVADPYQLHAILLEARKAGVEVVEMAQTQARTESDQALYDAIRQKTVRHFNSPELNKAIFNAVAIEGPRGFRLAKEQTSRKIDAAVALSMAHYEARNVVSRFIHMKFMHLMMDQGEEGEVEQWWKNASPQRKERIAQALLDGVSWPTIQRQFGIPSRALLARIADRLGARVPHA